jgi:heparosan-N-sulfate-glucuronate 5-epimerase
VFLNKIFDLIFDRTDYWHGPQTTGAFFCLTELRGYYNDLRKKVDRSYRTIDELPKVVSPLGEKFLHPVTVCQVGLGAYDKFIEDGDTTNLDLAIMCGDHLAKVLKEEKKICVPYSFPLFNQAVGWQSGLIYGQTASLLLRISLHTGGVYEPEAELCLEKLLLDINEGGCFNVSHNVIEEYPPSIPSAINCVLNGWIASIWALFDGYLYFKCTKYQNHYLTQIKTLSVLLPRFSILGWSRYSLHRSRVYYNVASPYYHREHIEQLNVVYIMTGNEVFRTYCKKFSRSLRLRFLYSPLMLIKGITVVIQKLLGLR